MKQKLTISAKKSALNDMRNDGVRTGVLFERHLICKTPDVTKRVGLLGLI